MRKALFILPLVLMLFILIPTTSFAQEGGFDWTIFLNPVFGYNYAGNVFYQARNVIMHYQPELSISQSHALRKTQLSTSWVPPNYVYWLTSHNENPEVTIPYQVHIDCTNMPDSFYYKLSWYDEKEGNIERIYDKSNCEVIMGSNNIHVNDFISVYLPCYEAVGTCDTQINVVAKITDATEYSSFGENDIIYAIIQFGGIAKRVEYIQQPVLTSFAQIETLLNMVALSVVNITILILNFIELTLIVLVFLAVPFLLIVGLKLIMRKLKDMLSGDEFPHR